MTRRTKMSSLLSGNVLYSYEDELLQRSRFANFSALFSGISPFHCHEGVITLSQDKIVILGDEHLEIPLDALEQIFLGFDEAFPRSLVKNMGLFWQPLRLSLSNGKKLYLIIDFNMIGAKNQLWFDGIKEISQNN